jgi:hypothetical protein
MVAITDGVPGAQQIRKPNYEAYFALSASRAATIVPLAMLDPGCARHAGLCCVNASQLNRPEEESHGFAKLGPSMNTIAGRQLPL